MTPRSSLRYVLPIVALVLLATACDAPSAGGAAIVTPPAAAPTSATIAFPQQAPALGPQAYPAVRLEGTLVLENDSGQLHLICLLRNTRVG